MERPLAILIFLVLRSIAQPNTTNATTDETTASILNTDITSPEKHELLLRLHKKQHLPIIYKRNMNVI